MDSVELVFMGSVLILYSLYVFNKYKKEEK